MNSNASWFASLEGVGRKLLLVPGLLITSIATILLLAGNRRPWASSGSFQDVVDSKRATVQLIVSILASVFSILNVYAVCSLISLATRLRLARSPHTLDTLGFWSAICLHQLDWSLPVRLIAALLLFRCLTFVPAAIWTGALTPIQINVTQTAPPTLVLPRYSTSATYSILHDWRWIRAENATRLPSGTFSYSPNFDLQGLILNQAAAYSNDNNDSQTHQKLDNTKYSYLGRSYGVGASVDLTDNDWADATTLGYQFTEAGYLTNVSCTVNASTDWKMEIVEQTLDGTYPDIWLVSGSLPNGEGQGYAACTLARGNSIFALVGSSYNGSSFFAIATGDLYAAFNQIQCSVNFVPTVFNVSVSRTKRLIEVTARQNSSLDAEPRDIESKGNLTTMAMRVPTSFSQQHACDLYSPLVGSTFTQNVQTMNSSFDPKTSNDDPQVRDLVLSSVEATLTSMLDNTLLAFSGAQLVVAKDTYNVPGTLTIRATRIGTGGYIYAIAVINFAIVLLSLFELVRTRVWKGLSDFDYTNVKSVTISASKGGIAVAEEARKLLDRKPSGKVDDRDLGQIKVLLEGKEDDLMLVGVSADGRQEKSTGRLWRRNKAFRQDTEMELLTVKGNAADRNW